MSKQKTKELLTTCSRCGGKGMMKLPSSMLETLAAIKGMKRITAGSLVKKMDWKGNPTAINNRLTALFKEGFLHRNKVSKTFIYTPVKF